MGTQMALAMAMRMKTRHRGEPEQRLSRPPRGDSCITNSDLMEGDEGETATVTPEPMHPAFCHIALGNGERFLNEEDRYDHCHAI
jgi:hypothetical protein